MQAACKLGFPVLYGDGSRPVVLQTAGIMQPKAVMVMYTGRQKSVQSVERLRQAFPKVRDPFGQFQLTFLPMHL